MTHSTKVGTLATSILQNQAELTAWQRKFLLHLFQLWLGMEGRHNFINMARYGDFAESTYRNNFAKPVSFLDINQQLVKDNLSRNRTLNFAPQLSAQEWKMYGWC